MQTWKENELEEKLRRETSTSNKPFPHNMKEV